MGRGMAITRGEVAMEGPLLWKMSGLSSSRACTAAMSPQPRANAPAAVPDPLRTTCPTTHVPSTSGSLAL